MKPLRALASVLIAVGAILLLDAGLTLSWQEPVSAVYTQFQQARLGDELEAAPPARDRQRARAFARRLEPGDPVGRLVIPSIDVSEVVVEGTDPDDLRAGPGHYARTALPGRRGTVAIAGHRTTYGAPFRRLDALAAGDRIELRMPYGNFAYRVERTRIVEPTEISVIESVGYDRLVLTGCHPLYSAAQRIVVFARLERP